MFSDLKLLWLLWWSHEIWIPGLKPSIYYRSLSEWIANKGIEVSWNTAQTARCPRSLTGILIDVPRTCLRNSRSSRVRKREVGILDQIIWPLHSQWEELSTKKDVLKVCSIKHQSLNIIKFRRFLQVRTVTFRFRLHKYGKELCKLRR